MRLTIVTSCLKASATKHALQKSLHFKPLYYWYHFNTDNWHQIRGDENQGGGIGHADDPWRPRGDQACHTSERQWQHADEQTASQPWLKSAVTACLHNAAHHSHCQTTSYTILHRHGFPSFSTTLSLCFQSTVYLSHGQKHITQQQYDTIQEFNVDSKATCAQLHLEHAIRNRKV